jgi:hypothetical protein
MRHHTIHIRKDRLRTIAEELVRQARDGGTPFEVTEGGVTLVLTATVSHGQTRMTTGVEFLGRRETYARDDVRISGLALAGAYDGDGAEVRTDLDVRELPLERDTDTLSVRVSYAPLPSDMNAAGTRVGKTGITVRRLPLRLGKPFRPIPEPAA